MKKLTALLLALIMVLAIGATALAGEPETGSGSETPTTTTTGDTKNNTNDHAGSLDDPAHPNNPAIKTLTDNTITLNKTLIFFNPEKVDVYEPNITYTYKVTPVNVNEDQATVTDDGYYNDDTPVTVHVKDGVADGLTVTTAAQFSDANKVKDVTPEGTLVEKNIVLTIVPEKFTAAGIYRYKLTDETEVSDLNSVGITRAEGTDGYKADRYIDLYVKNVLGTDGKPTGELKVENVVVFSTTSVTDPTTGKITPETIKTTGFNESPQSDNDYTDDKLADHYYTYNLKVEKETDGVLADKSNKFPFAVTINDIKAKKITYAAVGVAAANAADEAVSSDSVTKGELSDSSVIKLADGESVTFYGIPFGAKATVSEYNNTKDQYVAKKDDTKTTADSANKALAADVTLTAETPSVKAELADILIDAGKAHTAADDSQSSEATTLAHFKNFLPEISPTGVVLRVAPYAIMLGAGVVLFIVLKLRKNKAVEEA